MITTRSSYLLLALTLLASAFSAQAAPLSVSVAGVFQPTVVPTTLAAPSSTWSFSFDIDSKPAAFNVLGGSFDVVFSNFTYRLAGKPVAATPQTIRFYDAANDGLFTLFFGPESGFVNGVPIPEFEFSGPQAYSGTAIAPLFAPGKFPVSEWIFADAVNFADRFPASDTVTISAVATTTPEPASASLFLLASAAGLTAAYRCRRAA